MIKFMFFRIIYEKKVSFHNTTK